MTKKKLSIENPTVRRLISPKQTIRATLDLKASKKWRKKSSKKKFSKKDNRNYNSKSSKVQLWLAHFRFAQIWNKLLVNFIPRCISLKR